MDGMQEPVISGVLCDNAAVVPLIAQNLMSWTAAEGGLKFQWTDQNVTPEGGGRQDAAKARIIEVPRRDSCTNRGSTLSRSVA